MEMIENSGRFTDTYGAWSSDELKRYQTKISRLSGSIKNDILDHRVCDLFSVDERETIAKAAKILEGFKDTVTHAKEVMKREEARNERVRKSIQEQALKLFSHAFEHYSGSSVSQLRFVLAVVGVPELRWVRCSFDKDIERAKKDDNIKRLSNQIDQKFKKYTFELAYLCTEWGGENLDLERAQKLISNVEERINNPKQAEQKLIDEAALFLAKNSEGLSEKDRKLLGLK